MMDAKTLAFHMYPKDIRGNYEQREDFPEYIRMAEIAIALLRKELTNG